MVYRLPALTCQICAQPSLVIINNLFQERSCTKCLDWTESIFAYTRSKLYRACGENMYVVHLMAETDDIDRRLFC